MANDRGEKTIVLVQKWGAGKIAIGSEFRLKDSDRTLILTQCEGYPNGKFIFTDGEEFDVGKYFDAYFFEVVKDMEEELKEEIYDEKFWDELDKTLNGTDNGTIRKTFASVQENKSFHDFLYYDVTEIIDLILKAQEKKIDSDDIKKLYNYLNDNYFPVFTKEKLLVMFGECKLESTSDKMVLKVVKGDKVIGYLIGEEHKYIFAPKNKSLKDEYVFENDNSTGFFYTAESYLDVALTTLEKYKQEFIQIYHSDSEKNVISYGYQADSTIRTLLAFSCECYLKALLIDKGKNLNDIKDLGHGLSILYTSLDDDEIARVFTYMERKGFDLSKSMYQSFFETNDLTEKFMLDLARVDAAFIDSRYCAEKDKNTDYSFLYQFAVALRNCSKKEFMLSSPFSESIDSKIGNKKH